MSTSHDGNNSGHVVVDIAPPNKAGQTGVTSPGAVSTTVSDLGHMVAENAQKQDNKRKDSYEYTNELAPDDMGSTTSLFRKIVFGQGPRPEKPKHKHWENLKLELRRFLSECHGTAVLVFFHAGTGVINQWLLDRGQPFNQVAAGLVMGFIILALAYSLGSISGAHLNPIVTLAFTLRGTFIVWRLPFYLASQFVGAIIGAAFLRAVFGNVAYLGSNVPPPYSSSTIALGTEIIGTYVFITVVLSTARSGKVVGTNAALAVGVCFASLAIIFSGVSSISLNPTRSLAPAIVSGGGPHWSVIWPFLVGPIAGCFLAVILERALASQRGLNYRAQKLTCGGNGGN